MIILAEGLTAGGWIIMLLSVGGVSTLFVSCLIKVLKGPKNKGD